MARLATVIETVTRLARPRPCGDRFGAQERLGSEQRYKFLNNFFQISSVKLCRTPSPNVPIVASLGEQAPSNDQIGMQTHAEDGAPPAAASAGAAQHPVTRVREQFSVAATALTRLYRSPDRSRFAQAANAVTNLYREAEADAFRANHRG
jgi:hypothetical protein